MANQRTTDKKPGGGDVTKADKVKTPEVQKTTWNSVGGHTGPMSTGE